MLAEKCYLALAMHPSMSIIGVTGVDEQYRFGSSHPEESRMKSLMLRAEVQCVVLDSSKINDMAGSDWIFSDLDTVDIIITDQGLLRDRKVDFLRQAEEQDVFVLIAK